MLATISKWGNSRALRIPKQLALEAGLDFGSKVEIVLEDGQLRIVLRQRTALYTRRTGSANHAGESAR